MREKLEKLILRNRALSIISFIIVILAVGTFSVKAFSESLPTGTVMDNVNIENYTNIINLAQSSIGDFDAGGIASITPGILQRSADFDFISRKDSNSSVRIVRGTEYLKLGSTTHQEFWVNDTNKDIFIYDVNVYAVPDTLGNKTASSSYILEIGTTTASTVADFTDVYAGLIDDYTIATSSNVLAKLINLRSDGGTDGVGGAKLSSTTSEVLFVNLQEQFEKTLGQGYCNGVTCEAASSTNRGFDLEVIIDYFFLENN